ncbi:SDR family oxidoreductase (plasmid) [Cupriavidus basilensis]|uniref:SDR family oxidoreductase n=1 Tax=Cupriavidus basilensis TaxID=68895 RepID=A0A643FYP2_9BURK|nr:SDR family oxidoreductase [Cupriavidus basilensis]
MAIPLSFLPPPKSRIAVVGGCGGMGQALVNAASDHGLRVAVLDLQRSIDDCMLPEGVLALPCDVSDEASVAAAFGTLRTEWQGLDTLVNLAGYTGEQILVKDLPTAEWDAINDCCLRGMFLVTQHALPLRRRPGGARNRCGYGCQPQALRPRTRRKVGEHRLGQRGPRSRARRHPTRHLRQRRPNVLRRVPHPGSAQYRRRLHRTVRRARPADPRRRSAGSPDGDGTSRVRGPFPARAGQHRSRFRHDGPVWGTRYRTARLLHRAHRTAGSLGRCPRLPGGDLRPGSHLHGLRHLRRSPRHREPHTVRPGGLSLEQPAGRKHGCGSASARRHADGELANGPGPAHAFRRLQRIGYRARGHRELAKLLFGGKGCRNRDSHDANADAAGPRRGTKRSLTSAAISPARQSSYRLTGMGQNAAVDISCGLAAKGLWPAKLRFHMSLVGPEAVARHCFLEQMLRIRSETYRVQRKVFD